jgi:hypothetical protein
MFTSAGGDVGLGAGLDALPSQKAGPGPQYPHLEQQYPASLQPPFPTIPFPHVPTPPGDAVGLGASLLQKAEPVPQYPHLEQQSVASAHFLSPTTPLPHV